jgi:hypothetical protein
MEIAAVYDNLMTRPKSGGAYDLAVGERGRPRMSLDPVVLSRAQFTWMIAWHSCCSAATSAITDG